MLCLVKDMGKFQGNPKKSCVLNRVVVVFRWRDSVTIVGRGVRWWWPTSMSFRESTGGYLRWCRMLKVAFGMYLNCRCEGSREVFLFSRPMVGDCIMVLEEI